MYPNGASILISASFKAYPDNMLATMLNIPLTKNNQTTLNEYQSGLYELG